MTTSTTPAAAVAPYDALAEVYDRWTAGNDYAGWADFIAGCWRRRGLRAPRVLDLCCGTGTLTALLRERGARPVGVDASAAMLAKAAAKLGPEVPLVRAALPDIPVDGAFEAAVCSFDSLNYLADEGALAATLERVAALLAPAGLFVFDLNTRRKLREVFGDSHYGDDLGDYAYVWRNRYDHAAEACDFLITVFVARGDRFERSEERHRQRVFSPEVVRRLATGAGFGVAGVHDGYRAVPCGPETMRETWVLDREAG
jgi:SAM-dependent methyltransferase